MNDLVEFFKARLDEAEEVARSMNLGGTGFTLSVAGGPTVYTVERALADVAAKRRIVAEYVEMRDSDDHGEMRLIGYEEGLKAAVEMLAQVHRDHPDFDPSWGI